MTGFLRRLRGAVFLGVLWAIPWGVAGTLASPIIRGFAHARPPQSLADRLVDGMFIGWYGFLAGLAFSLVLAFAARRRSMRELTPGRAAVWGLASSVLLTAPPMIAMLIGRTDGWRPEDPFYLGGSLVLSAACAATSLLLARRGAPDEREWIAENGGVTAIADGEARSVETQGRSQVRI
jgi:hypothetical protein